MPARFEIAKVGPEKHAVRAIGLEELNRGDEWFYYKLAVDAEKVEQGRIGDEEWRNRKVKNGKMILVGRVLKGDSVIATNTSSARCEVRKESPVPSFNVTYIDETAKEPKRRTLAKKRTDYKLWRGPLGIEPRLRPAFVHNGLAFIGRLLP